MNFGNKNMQQVVKLKLKRKILFYGRLEEFWGGVPILINTFMGETFREESFASFHHFCKSSFHANCRFAKVKLEKKSTFSSAFDFLYRAWWFVNYLLTWAVFLKQKTLSEWQIFHSVLFFLSFFIITILS